MDNLIPHDTQWALDELDKRVSRLELQAGIEPVDPEYSVEEEPTPPDKPGLGPKEDELYDPDKAIGTTTKRSKS